MAVRKHGCARCGKHKRRVAEYLNKSGKVKVLCDDCARTLEAKRGTQ